MGSLLVGAELADDINHTEQRDRYLRSADDVRAAVNDNLWDSALGHTSMAICATTTRRWKRPRVVFGVAGIEPMGRS